MLNTSDIIATLDHAADTLEKLEPVLNASFAARDQVDALRAGSQALAACPPTSLSADSARGCDGRALGARWQAVPVKPTKNMLVAAHERLLAAGHNVTFETVKATYLCFLSEAPPMPTPPEASSETDAPAVHLAPYAG